MNSARAVAGGLWAAGALFAIAFGPQCGGGGRGTDSGANGEGGVTQADGRVDALIGDGTLGDDSAPPDSAPQGDAGGLTDSGTPFADGAVCPQPRNDAGLVSDWYGFRRMTEVDPCCRADVALSATRTAPPLKWIPCLNGASGCLEVQAAPFNYAGVSVDDAGDTAFLYIARLLGPVVIEDDIYDFASGVPLAAWRSDRSSGSCAFDPLLANSQIALVGYLDAGSLVAHGDPSQLAASVPQYVHIGAALLPEGLGYSGSSETTFGFDLFFGGSLGRAPLDGGSNYATVPVPGQVAMSFVSRDDVFGVSTHGTTGWGQAYLMRADNTVVPFRTNPSAHVTGLQTDGPNLYWMETYGSTDIGAMQQDTQVWTAPYTNDPAQLAATARQIADIHSSWLAWQAIAFGGYYAFGGASFVYVVRAADGAVSQVPFAGNYVPWQLTYVTGTDLWAVMSQGTNNGVAFARVALGPWSGGD